MKTRNILCALLTLIAVGCMKEQPAGNENNLSTGKGKTITVNMPEMTRTAIGEDTQTGVSLIWSKGDEIAVIEGKGTEAQKFSVYRLVGEGGTASGTFEYVSGEADDEFITDVVFPASAVENNYAIPTDQTYVEGSFDTDAMVMSWTRKEDDEAIVLTHEAAALLVRLSGTSGQKVSSIDVTCNDQTYTLACTEPVVLNASGKEFYIAVPGSSASLDYSVTVHSNYGTKMSKSITYALNAGKIGRLPLTPLTPAHGLKVGDYFEGGVVFEAKDSYVKVLSIRESGPLAWSTENISTGCTESLDDGLEYTQKLLALSSYSAETYPAAAWCTSLGEGWYLPATKELANIRINLLQTNTAEEDATKKDAANELMKSLGGDEFTWAMYWSCMENASDNTKAHVARLNKKLDSYYGKVNTTGYAARAVKKIAIAGGETPDPKPQIYTTDLAPTKDASFTNHTGGQLGIIGTELRVRYASDQYKYATYFEFDISDLKTQTFKTGILNLSVRPVFKDVTETTYAIRLVTDNSWTESTSIKKGPDTKSSDFTTLSVSKTDTKLSVDLTGLIEDCLENGQNVLGIKFMVKEVDGNKNSNDNLYIYSKEHDDTSLRPYLQITELK